MKTEARSPCWTALRVPLLLSVSLGRVGEIGGYGMELPLEVRGALERNAAALDPITVEWRRERKSPYSVSALLKRTGRPPYAVDILEPERVEFRCQNRMMYARREYRAAAQDKDSGKVTGFLRRLEEASFDGTNIYLGSFGTQRGFPGEQALIIRPKDTKKEGAEVGVYFPKGLLHEAGFRLAVGLREVGQGAESSVLAALREGAELRSAQRKPVDARDRLAVELAADGGKHTYYLAPKWGYAVCRREDRNADGELYYSVDLHDFRRLPKTPDVWFPWQCETNYFAYPKRSMKVEAKPLMHDVYRVLGLSQEPIAPGVFTLVYTEPGTKISDGTLPEAIEARTEMEYEIPANPEDLDEVIARARKGLVGPKPKTRVISWFVIAANVALMIVLALAVWWRRKRLA